MPEPSLPYGPLGNNPHPSHRRLAIHGIAPVTGQNLAMAAMGAVASLLNRAPGHRHLQASGNLPSGHFCPSAWARVGPRGPAWARVGPRGPWARFREARVEQL